MGCNVMSVETQDTMAPTDPEEQSTPDVGTEEEVVAASAEGQADAEEKTEAADVASTTPDATPDAPAEGEAQEASVEGADAPDEEAPAEPEVDPYADKVGRLDWYIIRVNTGYEDRVQKSLDARIAQTGLDGYFGRIVVPKSEVLEYRRGEKKRIKRKLYPGYVFVEMFRAAESQMLVREVPRVSGFVGAESGRKDPKPITPREVKRLLSHIEQVVDAPEVVQHFERGDKLKIVDGAFSNFQGVVDDVREERRKLRVLVTIFGRQTPVEVTYSQVERID